MTADKLDLDRSRLTPEELRIVTPNALGPTWQKDASGNWLIPEHSLGWQIAAWCADYLRGPDGGPWMFTDEQFRFLLWWYAIDEDGRWAYRTGVLQRCKGWGKDPLLAVICIVEFVGPCRFSHWEGGEPVAVSNDNAWVQLVGTSMEQTKNTMAAIPSIVTERLKREYGIEPGAVLWRAMGKTRRLEAITSNHRTMEGNRPSFVVLNEVHHWVSGNGGHDLYYTIDGNVTKIANSRYMAITNAFLPGEDSVGERLRKTADLIIEGRAKQARFLYDSLEAQADAPLSGHLLPYVLDAVRGDAYWLDIQATMDSIAQAHITPSRSRRMYLNQIVASEEAIYGPAQWDPLGIDVSTPDGRPDRGETITLGFDGSKSGDSTALVAIRVSDNCAFTLGLWEPPEYDTGEWEVDRHSVDSAVHQAFAEYDVVGFFCDVSLWESYIDSWAELYGAKVLINGPSAKNPFYFDMRGAGMRVPQAHERLVQTIYDGRLKHNKDPRLRRHVLNAHRAFNNYGMTFRKESPDSSRKVDAYAALMLAHEAAAQFRITGKQRKVSTGMGYFL